MLNAWVELHSVNLSRTQTVVAQYDAGRIGIDQNPNDCNPFFALLNRKALEVFIKLTHARGERLAIMSAWIEKLLFKHV